MSGFVRVLGKDQHLALAHKIKSDLPFCAPMYNHLSMCANSYKATPTYVLSNKPDSHAVMWLTKKDKNTYAAFYCREQEVDQLTEALRETTLLDWSEFFMFYHLPDYLVGPLKKVAEDSGSPALRTWLSYTFTYQRGMDYGPLRCDAGFRVCRLGNKGLKNIIERNRYVKDNPVEIEWHSEYKVPAVGVYLDPTATESTLIDVGDLPLAGDEEVPVSWMTMTMQGSLGRLGTHEDYRRRGLGTLTVRVLARILFEQGYIPYVRVLYDNSPSLAMIRKMPEWIYAHTDARMAPAYYDFP